MADPYGKTNLQPGFRLFDGSALNRLFARVLQGGLNRETAITAHAGGTKAAAYQLTRSLNLVATTATNGDSVLLPKAIAGSMVVVTNAGAATLSVYGKGVDTIDGVSTATANSLATTKTRIYVCYATGAWFTMISA